MRAIFAGYAATLGLDVERFKKDMDTEEVKARIKLDQERGASIGVDRTPILFVDGVQIPFCSFNVDALHAAIGVPRIVNGLNFQSATAARNASLAALEVD